MPSLAESQRAFADAVLGPPGTPPAFGVVARIETQEAIGVYRNNVFGNYRKALAATYPVVQRLVGVPFFHGAVDAFVLCHPSRSGDLNDYGREFGDFLAAYEPAGELPYLADVARLEWAIDEANRAADAASTPSQVLAALAAVPSERLGALKLSLAPACRLVASRYPLLHIWQVTQPGYQGDARVGLDEGGEHLLLFRDDSGIPIERIAAADHAWLSALASGAALAEALDSALTVDAAFDLTAALRTYVGRGIIAAVANQASADVSND